MTYRPPLQFCPSCQSYKYLTLNNFPLDPRTKSGYAAQCHSCLAEEASKPQTPTKYSRACLDRVFKVHGLHLCNKCGRFFKPKMFKKAKNNTYNLRCQCILCDREDKKERERQHEKEKIEQKDKRS